MKKTFAFLAMLCLVSMFAGKLATAQTLTCQKYPASQTFTIDGDLSEWPADAKVIDSYTRANRGNHNAGPVPADITFSVYLAWDSTYLYIGYDVTDPTGLDETQAIANRYLDDMYRLYLETDTDGAIHDGPDNDEFGIDLRASTTGPLNEVTVISWNSGNFTDPTDTNLNGDANGTMVATTAANGATAYTWEARVAWADVLAHAAANSKNLSAPQDGDVWTWDMLLIDDGPVDGEQFNLTTLHAPSGWATINFVDSSVTPVTAGVPLIHDGLYAAQLTRTTGGGDSGFDINDAKIDVTGISTVKVSWWMRSGNEGGADSTITSFGVAPFDSNQNYLGGTYGEPNLVSGDNVVGADWEFRSYEYAIPGADVNFINLGIRMPVGNSIVVDELKIVDTANPGVNLVANGSFENWGGGGLVGAAADAVANDGVPDSWRFFAVGGAQSILARVGNSVPTDVQEGRYSAKYTRTVLGGDSAFDKDFAPAPDGHIDITGIAELQISFWMRSGSSNPVKLNPQIQTWVGTTFTPPNPSPFAYFDTNLIPPTWTYYTFTYTCPADITDLSLRFGLGTAGDSFVIDGVSVVNTATGENILPNGGMEDWGGGNRTGDPVTPDGVPDYWRCFAVSGAGATLNRLEFQPVINAVRLDWTTMK